MSVVKHSHASSGADLKFPKLLSLKLSFDLIWSVHLKHYHFWKQICMIYCNLSKLCKATFKEITFGKQEHFGNSSTMYLFWGLKLRLMLNLSAKLSIKFLRFLWHLSSQELDSFSIGSFVTSIVYTVVCSKNGFDWLK